MGKQLTIAVGRSTRGCRHRWRRIAATPDRRRSRSTQRDGDAARASDETTRAMTTRAIGARRTATPPRATTTGATTTTVRNHRRARARGRSTTTTTRARETFEGEIIDGEYSDAVTTEEEATARAGGSAARASGLASGLARLDALSEAMGAVYATTGDVVDVGGSGDEDARDDDASAVSLGVIDVGAGGEMARQRDVETVQLIKCKFQMRRQMAFGEELRLVGSHASMGAWDMTKSLTLTWGEGDVWTSDDVELPVDGVFIYKYAVVPAGQPEIVTEWQQGNNQVLTLTPDDLPRLWVTDNWSGNPDMASVFREGGEASSKESRLINRVKAADERVKVAEIENKALKGDLQQMTMQVNALREEARLGANVRIALKEQLRAEQRRSNVLGSQVDAWKTKFQQLTDGTPSKSAAEAPPDAAQKSANKGKTR